jgi:hypothetical protein
MDASVLIIGSPINEPMRRDDFIRDLFKISETAAAPSKRPVDVTNQTEDKCDTPYCRCETTSTPGTFLVIQPADHSQIPQSPSYTTTSAAILYAPRSSKTCCARPA